MTFNIGLSSVPYGEALSQKYTCDGQDTSPEISWTEAPSSAKSYVLIMEDPDARHGPFVHWILYNIKPNVKQVPEGLSKEESVPEIGTHGINDFGKTGYNGPCPPGKKVHRYVFTLYALRDETSLPPGLKKKDLAKLISDKTVKQASVMVKYGRAYQ